MDGEMVSLIFDKPDIEKSGVDFSAAAQVAEAFRNLCDEAAKFRAHRSLGPELSIGTLSRVVNLSLRTPPKEGSLKLAIYLSLAASAISVAADASQFLGYNVRDALEAVRTVQGQTKTPDEISGDFASSPAARAAAAGLLQAAGGSGCTYVAIEYGNELVILHGGREARQALIGTKPAGVMSPNYVPSEISGSGQVIDVTYRGRSYKAFLIDDRGRGAGATSPRSSGLQPVAMLIWASKHPLPQGVSYSVNVEKVDASEVTHGEHLPADYIVIPKVYLVTGASVVNFE